MALTSTSTTNTDITHAKIQSQFLRGFVYIVWLIVLTCSLYFGIAHLISLRDYAGADLLAFAAVTLDTGDLLIPLPVITLGLVILKVVAGLPFLLLAVVVFLYRSDNWLALWLSFTSVSLLLAMLMRGPGEHAQIGAVLLFLNIALGMPLLYVLPNGQLPSRWFAAILATYIPWEAYRAYATTFNTSAPFLLFPWYLLPWVAMTIGIIVVQNRRYRGATPVYRQQMKWLLLGIVMFAILQVAGNFGITWLLPLNTSPILTTLHIIAHWLCVYLSYAVLGTGFLIAVTRYRLYDINILINRSLVGGAVTVLLALLFTGTVFVLQALLKAENQILALGLSALVPVVFFNPTHKRVRHLIDRHVYGLAFDLNELRAAQRQRTITKPGALSGIILDGYELGDVIGKGGMGEVYQGFGQGRTVAVKTMLAEIAQERDMQVRFHREAEIGQILQHPNIVKIFSSGETNGTPYMIMEYVEGQDLRDCLKAGQVLDTETATRIMQDICAALDTAHHSGFVHRDLKPANIMLKTNGEAVLMDFGVTKMADATSSLTGTGAVGTIDYMAPEQINAAHDVDHRADIYALGVMLYEMLTGLKPFPGSVAQVLFAHLQQPAPDPHDINETISRPIAKAIMKAMAKNPEDRFQSAGEFAAALILN